MGGVRADDRSPLSILLLVVLHSLRLCTEGRPCWHCGNAEQPIVEVCLGNTLEQWASLCGQEYGDKGQIMEDIPPGQALSLVNMQTHDPSI